MGDAAVEVTAYEEAFLEHLRATDALREARDVALAALPAKDPMRVSRPLQEAHIRAYARRIAELGGSEDG